MSNDDNLATVKHTVGNLADGKWYFRVQAKDQNDLMSPPSEVVSKKI